MRTILDTEDMFQIYLHAVMFAIIDGCTHCCRRRSNSILILLRTDRDWMRP